MKAHWFQDAAIGWVEGALPSCRKDGLKADFSIKSPRAAHSQPWCSYCWSRHSWTRKVPRIAQCHAIFPSPEDHLLSSHYKVFMVQSKHWEPLLFVPAFAMGKRAGPVRFGMKPSFSSFFTAAGAIMAFEVTIWLMNLGINPMKGGTL